MKRIFLKLNNRKSRYEVEDGYQTRSFELQDVFNILENNNFDWIHVTKSKNFIRIWSEWSFKEPAKIEFKTLDEKLAFERSYNEYYDKRWDDMTSVKLSYGDYDKLIQKWQSIDKEKPEYVIFSLNDSDHIHTVDVVGKNELSEQDIIDAKQEHEKFLRYEKARNSYRNNLLDYSDIWRSSADDEYDSDIEKYYNTDLVN
jgi:hypothetical protein